MAAPAALSPLAPKKYPALPPIDGVRFATAAAGVRYAGRTDVMLALFDAPATRRRRVHPLQMPLGAGRLVPRQSRSGAGPRADRQFRQRQRVHRRRSASSGRGPCRGSGEQGHRRRRRADIHGLDRGDRRAARRRQDRRACSSDLNARAAPDGLMDAARAIMTTDTFPKVATARVKIGETEVVDQRDRQGRRDDRAGHGDDARVRVHRRADRRARAASDARQIRRSLVQLHHRRQRHLDVGHADDVRHRRGGEARRAGDRRSRAIRVCSVQAGAR